MAVRAFSAEEHSPADVVARAHRLAQRLTPAETATLLYAVFDPAEGIVRFCRAGHPPPLLLSDGRSRLIESRPGPPLAAVAEATYEEAVVPIGPGATLLLFTDGLVERRDLPVQEGLDRLCREAAAGPSDLDGLCDHLLATLLMERSTDDVALVAMRPSPAAMPRSEGASAPDERRSEPTQTSR
jgi:serine phosphatase RsbU (regulator of sigma subunit)